MIEESPAALRRGCALAPRRGDRALRHEQPGSFSNIDAPDLVAALAGAD
jgi:hypothetical protein